MEDKVLKSISIALIALVAIAGFYCGAPHVIVNKDHFYKDYWMYREHIIEITKDITLGVNGDPLAAIPPTTVPLEELTLECGDQVWVDDFDEDGNAVGVIEYGVYHLDGPLPAENFKDITEEYKSEIEAKELEAKKEGDEAYQAYRSHLLLWFMYPDVGGNLRRGLVVGITLLFFGILLYRLMSKGKIYFIACWSTVLFLVISLNLFFTMPCR